MLSFYFQSEILDPQAYKNYAVINIQTVMVQDPEERLNALLTVLSSNFFY